MNNKFIKREFDKMEVPEIDIKENVLNSIHENRPRSRREFRPKAILAIAMTFIMITGAVFAAGKLINVVVEEPAEDEIARYKMDIDLEGVSLDHRVSQDLLTYAKDINNLEEPIGSEHFKRVESYDEVEEYLNINLLQSPILNKSFEPSSLVGKASINSNISISANAVDENIVSVYVDSQHRILETDGLIYLGAYLMTPLGKEIYGDFKIQSGHYDIDNNSKREVLTETYTSKKSGITAEIIHISKTDRYSAYFVSDSIVYILESSYSGDALASKELLIEIIDSFDE